KLEGSQLDRQGHAECVASLGIPMADTVQTRKSNPCRARQRFARPNSADRARPRSRHIYDQPSSADRGGNALTSALASIGCQPVLFSRLPKSSSGIPCAEVLPPLGVVGKLPPTTD